MGALSEIHISALARLGSGGIVVLLWMAQALAATGDDWPLATGDHANTRYSALDQIRSENVAGLREVFSFDTGVPRGHEAAPLAVAGLLYVITPWPNLVYALDPSRPDAPVKWKFDPGVPRSVQGVACCDVVSRGMAYADGRLFLCTLDGQAIALDAASGRELWRTALAEARRGAARP